MAWHTTYLLLCCTLHTRRMDVLTYPLSTPTIPLMPNHQLLQLTLTLHCTTWHDSVWDFGQERQGDVDRGSARRRPSPGIELALDLALDLVPALAEVSQLGVMIHFTSWYSGQRSIPPYHTLRIATDVEPLTWLRISCLVISCIVVKVVRYQFYRKWLDVIDIFDMMSWLETRLSLTIIIIR